MSNELRLRYSAIATFTGEKFLDHLAKIGERPSREQLNQNKRRETPPMEFPAVERVIGDAEDPVYHLRYGVPLTIANLDPTFGSNSSVESDVAIHPTTSQEK